MSASYPASEIGHLRKRPHPQGRDPHFVGEGTETTVVLVGQIC